MARGSSENVNVYFLHVLVLDGGYVEADGTLRFVINRPANRDEFERTVASSGQRDRDIGRRLERLVNRTAADEEPSPHRHAAVARLSGTLASPPQLDATAKRSELW